MKYTRENVRASMLKTVIIRFDFSGLTDVRPFVAALKRRDWMRKAFQDLSIVPPSQSNFVNISRAGTLPVNENILSDTYRFENCSLEDNSNAILDISVKCICLSIDCGEHYSGTKKYTYFMAQVLHLLKVSDPYVKIDRIGIRKIDAQVIKDLKEVSDYFNEERFVVALEWNNEKLEASQTDLYCVDGTFFNIVQHMDRLATGSYRMIFDIDAYLTQNDANNLGLDIESTFAILDIHIQNTMFEFFLVVVSQKYLEKYGG